MSGKWSEPGVPHAGWSCVAITDNFEDGDDLTICEMCEVQPIRYVHEMEHPGYPDNLFVGCVCAGNMEQDYERAKKREDRFKRTKDRRVRWLSRIWQTSSKGNDYLNTEGFNVVIFRRDRLWHGRVQRRQSPIAARYTPHQRYQTAEQAKLAALDVMLEFKEQWPEVLAQFRREQHERYAWAHARGERDPSFDYGRLDEVETTAQWKRSLTAAELAEVEAEVAEIMEEWAGKNPAS